MAQQLSTTPSSIYPRRTWNRQYQLPATTPRSPTMFPTYSNSIPIGRSALDRNTQTLPSRPRLLSPILCPKDGELVKKLVGWVLQGSAINERNYLLKNSIPIIPHKLCPTIPTLDLIDLGDWQRHKLPWQGEPQLQQNTV